MGLGVFLFRKLGSILFIQSSALSQLTTIAGDETEQVVLRDEKGSVWRIWVLLRLPEASNFLWIGNFTKFPTMEPGSVKELSSLQALCQRQETQGEGQMQSCLEASPFRLRDGPPPAHPELCQVPQLPSAELRLGYSGATHRTGGTPHVLLCSQNPPLGQDCV